MILASIVPSAASIPSMWLRSPMTREIDVLGVKYCEDSLSTCHGKYDLTIVPCIVPGLSIIVDET